MASITTASGQFFSFEATRLSSIHARLNASDQTWTIGEHGIAFVRLQNGLVIVDAGHPPLLRLLQTFSFSASPDRPFGFALVQNQMSFSLSPKL